MSVIHVNVFRWWRRWAKVVTNLRGILYFAIFFCILLLLFCLFSFIDISPQIESNFEEEKTGRVVHLRILIEKLNKNTQHEEEQSPTSNFWSHRFGWLWTSPRSGDFFICCVKTVKLFSKRSRSGKFVSYNFSSFIKVIFVLKLFSKRCRCTGRQWRRVLSSAWWSSANQGWANPH